MVFEKYNNIIIIYRNCNTSTALCLQEQTDDKYDSLMASMREVAKNHKGKLLFVVIDAGQPENQRLGRFFNQ
jgi:hypothetical protein